MPNNLGNFNVDTFANEALLALKSKLGMSARVYRDYDSDTARKGDLIKIRKPPTFVAQSAPSTKQAIETGTTSVKLTEWDEVKFGLTDKELATSDSDKLINLSLDRAAYALALKLDTFCQGFIKQVPYYTIPAAVGLVFDDLAAVRESMFNRGVPFDGNVYGQVDGAMERKIISMLGNPTNQGAGVDSARVDAMIGRLAGIEWWANQNTPKFTTTQMADVAGVAAATAKGAVTLSVSGVDASGAVLAGDTFEIAGHTRRYTVTANATATTGTVPLNIFPELQIATVGSEVVTFHKLAGQRSMNSAFHRNFAALATAPLSRLGAELGAKIGVAYSDEAGLALRTRLYYNGDDSEVMCAVDVLYGGTVLDEQMATRFYSAA
jgi:hypothetical protein